MCHFPSAQGPPDDVFILSGWSQLDKDVTHIIEEVPLELVEVLPLVQVAVHLLNVLPTMYSSCLDAPG